MPFQSCVPVADLLVSEGGGEVAIHLDGDADDGLSPGDDDDGEEDSRRRGELRVFDPRTNLIFETTMCLGEELSGGRIFVPWSRRSASLNFCESQLS